MHLAKPAIRPAILRWLMDGDPVIRWQVMRDLANEPADRVSAVRSLVAKEGWGAQLLSCQSANGSWGGVDRGWLTTGRALTLLQDFGLNPDSPEARQMIARVKQGIFFESLENRPFLQGETEPCINGRILGIGAYFDEPNAALAERLLSEQLEDGGWNCEAPPSLRSSFHTTICVLEGLLAYERAIGGSSALKQARQRGERYLLERGLFRSLRTNEIIDKRWLRFSYPPFWHYDVLRGLDYLRDANVPKDSRMEDAVAVVLQRRHQNGRWPMNLLHAEHIPVTIETAIGSASRWNTLRALRILRKFG